MTIIDKACYERGCACYDDRVDKDGVEVVAQREVEANHEDQGEIMTELSDHEYHDRVMTLVTQLNTAMGSDTQEFSVTINALLTLLALSGARSELSRDEFVAAVTWQLGEIMSRMTVIDSPLQ